jgi:hypothetical protein
MRVCCDKLIPYDDAPEEELLEMVSALFPLALSNHCYRCLENCIYVFDYFGRMEDLRKVAKDLEFEVKNLSDDENICLMFLWHEIFPKFNNWRTDNAFAVRILLKYGMIDNIKP